MLVVHGMTRAHVVVLDHDGEEAEGASVANHDCARTAEAEAVYDADPYQDYHGAFCAFPSQTQ